MKVFAALNTLPLYLECVIKFITYLLDEWVSSLSIRNACLVFLEFVVQGAVLNEKLYMLRLV